MAEIPGSRLVPAGVERDPLELAKLIDVMLTESPRDGEGCISAPMQSIEFHEDEWLMMAAALHAYAR